MLTIVTDQLLVARPITGGFSWTLPSRLGQMLARAEAQFGQRNQSFTILGIEFRDGGPQVWFPGNRDHVVVQLSLSAMQDLNRAMFQLAHECFHLLDPAAGGSNVLDEGVATHFSLEFMQSEFRLQYPTGDPKYDRACALVRRMLSLRGDSARELRRLHGPLRHITAPQIMTICPGLDSQFAQQLIEPF
jgi:hypothetical protein